MMAAKGFDFTSVIVDCFKQSIGTFSIERNVIVATALCRRDGAPRSAFMDFGAAGRAGRPYFIIFGVLGWNRIAESWNP